MSDYEQSSTGRGPGANSPRREMDLFDIVALAWAEKILIVLVFLALFIPAAIAAYVLLQPTYEAQSRLLILLDEENPTPAAAGTGDAFVLDQVMQSEIEILNSDAVRRFALERSGAEVTPTALQRLRDGFSINRPPFSSVLIAQFESADPERAARTLNAIVDAYLAYRQEILLEDGAGSLSARLARAEIVAESAAADLRNFLISHDIGDFEAERAALIARISDLQTRLLAAEAEADAAQAGAAALRERLETLPQTIEQYVENDVSGQLLTLEVRRRELLARYLPEAPPVIAVEREIEALRDFIQSGGAEGAGQRRTGPNPIYQELDTTRLQQANAAVTQTRLARALRGQLANAREQSARLRALRPAYDRLNREAQAATLAAERLVGQVANADAQAAGSPEAAEAVRIVERAYPPDQASSLRKIGVIGAGVFALGLAMLTGLLRGYLTGYRPRSSPPPRVSRDAPPHAYRDAASQDMPPRAPHSTPTRKRRSMPVLARVAEEPASAPR
ncbi:hypothetical protein GCM10011367_10420 [Marinicauda pacifica]|uniref:Polysaccharide chain length determinant N-terminal domain-containing protein n=1 Tax=Marinicauda pacifica TaxID=1133559 RepID=A0A4S2HF70_9PROT|nr:Wzz/FepE/Etk N-terminal domain-containing protein [Marinicauda pacifica]TGY94686.1 hypothetical protein E5162_05290 [Marinicauda pacifica]GGE37930.1 hypothetical protein GCM10011367_10420 [Marinicauda pacifica]